MKCRKCQIYLLLAEGLSHQDHLKTWFLWRRLWAAYGSHELRRGEILVTYLQHLDRTVIKCCKRFFSTWTGQRFKTSSCAVSVTVTRPSCTSINHMTIFSCTSAGRVKFKKVYDGNQTYVHLLNCCCASDHLVAHMNLVGNL